MGNLPVDAKTLEEALQLNKEILDAIELETASLSSCMLKASRLARLLNDFEHEEIFIYENSGYPDIINSNIQVRKLWKLLILSKKIDNCMEINDTQAKKEKILEKLFLKQPINLHQFIII